MSALPYLLTVIPITVAVVLVAVCLVLGAERLGRVQRWREIEQRHLKCIAILNRLIANEGLTPDERWQLRLRLYREEQKLVDQQRLALGITYQAPPPRAPNIRPGYRGNAGERPRSVAGSPPTEG